MGLRPSTQGDQGPFAEGFLEKDGADGRDRCGGEGGAPGSTSQHQVEDGGGQQKQQHRLAKRSRDDASDTS